MQHMQQLIYLYFPGFMLFMLCEVNVLVV